MRSRYVHILLGALALPFIHGCTYLEVSVDQAKGGPTIRETAAQNEQDAVRDKGRGLTDDLKVLTEEQKLQDEKLAELNQRREAQEAKIARAMEENKITRADEQAMRERIMSLDREVKDLEFELEAARVNADAEQEEVLKKRLAALEGKASQLDSDIENLLLQ